MPVPKFPSAAVSLLMPLTLVTTASAQTPSCPRGLKPQAVAEIIFGRNIGEIVGAVSETEWLRFIDEEVTPRFPAGLTVIDAAGQWLDRAAGRIEREPAKVLLIVMTKEAEQSRQIADLAAVYKRRFSQQSVIVMVRRACVAM